MRGLMCARTLPVAGLLLAVGLCTVAQAEDSRDAAQQSADRSLSQVIAWEVLKAAGKVKQIDQPAETPAERLIGAGRDAYLTYARSEERGKERGTKAAVLKRLAEVVASEELRKRLAPDLEAFGVLKIGEKTTVAQLQGELAACLYNRMPAYRTLFEAGVLQNVGQLFAALAEMLTAGQAIRKLPKRN